MEDITYYRVDGSPIGPWFHADGERDYMLETSAWMDQRRAHQQVARWTRHRRVWVSTIYLGLDHSFGFGPPLIFETMVFPKGHRHGHRWDDLFMDRYPSLEQARLGHQRIVDRIKSRGIGILTGERW